MTINPIYVRCGQSAHDNINDVIHTQLLYIIDRRVIIVIVIILIIVIIKVKIKFLLPLEHLGGCAMLPFCTP